MILKRGRRLVIRDMVLKDVDRWGYWMRSGHEWQKLDAPYYHEDYSDSQIDEWMIERREALSGEPDHPEPRLTATIALIDSDDYLGFLSRYWISKETNWVALGIVIYDPAHWRKGYGYEALGLWTEYVFESDLALARLDLQTWSGNVGMMRLANKLGYILEGRFRKARVVDGNYYDALGYGVLREEWQARYPNGFAASL